MEAQIILLKKKIKQLQTQLCQRTRNYLYHFKKSPTKHKISTKQQSVQTQSTDRIFKLYQSKQLSQSDQQNDIKDFQHVQLSQLLTKQPKNQQDKRFKKVQTQSKIHFCSFNLQNTGLDLDFKQQNQKHHLEIQNLSAQIRMMKQQLQNSKSPSNISKIQYFSPSRFITPNQSDSMMQKSYTSRFQTINQQSSSSLKYETQSQSQLIQKQHLKKQLKILKKQVKKVRQHLEYEIKASNQTKQALLISQQQNYKFRLKIQQLNKQIKLLTGISSQSSNNNIDKIQNSLNLIQKQQSPLFFKQNDSQQSYSTKQQLQRFKNQNQKYQEHISILQGVKKDYLNKCIQAKQQIYKLKIQNQKLKSEIVGLKRLLSVQTLAIQSPNRKHQKQQKSTNQSIKQCPQQNNQKNIQQKIHKIQQKWSEIFKSKVHQISNCLPLKNDQEIFIFKPQTIEDLISMLQRILTFCQNIQQWEKQKIQAIQRERSNLLKIVSSVLIKHPNTKHTIAQQISQIPQLCYLVNFLNRQNRNVYEANHLDTNIIESQLKIQTQEFIQTN